MQKGSPQGEPFERSRRLAALRRHLFVFPLPLRGSRRPASALSVRLLIGNTAGSDLTLLLRLAAADLNPLGLWQRRFRNGKVQYATVEFRLDLVLIDARRKLERAGECAVAPLDHLVAIVLALFALALFFATDREDSVFGGDLHLVGLETRKLQLESDFALVFLDVDGRSEIAALSSEGVFKQPVDLSPEPENRCARRHSVEHFRLLCG